MKTWAVFVIANAIFVLGDLAQIAEIGETIDFTVLTWYDNDKKITCHLQTPREIIIFGPDDDWDKSKYKLTCDVMRCTVTLTVTSAGDSGHWQIFYTTEDGKEVTGPEYNLIVPADEVEAVDIHTKSGDTVYVIITDLYYLKTESCHLVTNDGRQYEKPDLPRHTDIEWYSDPNAACGIALKVQENNIGNWTLFTRDFTYSIERRKQFTIYVEETVLAVPDEAMVSEGNDLHVRLYNSPGDLMHTCELQWPKEVDQPYYYINPPLVDYCGFVIKNVTTKHTGVWYIKYGTGVTFLAPIRVSVYEKDEDKVDSHLEWVDGEEVFTMMGPEDATYCRIVDPTGRQVFEQFSRCVLYLVKAEEHHEGIWTLTVGRPGTIVTEQHKVKVSLVRAHNPSVITSLERQDQDLLLSCALSTVDHHITSCKFLSPNGKVLLATPGIGNGRYSAYTDNVTLDHYVNTTSYGIRITNTTNEDRGFWRCTIDTADKLYYGFLNVNTIREDNSIVSAEPTLTPSKLIMSVPEGATTLMCSIPSSIRYCYFRSQTAVFNVNEGTATDSYEYVGLGFDAGECGIRLKHLPSEQSGLWSCHVGVQEEKLQEHRSFFSVSIYKPYEASHRLVNAEISEVQLRFHDYTTLEYCRFIRSDGLGFTTNSAFSNNYSTWNKDRSCGMHIFRPTRTDMNSWIVVAKVEGHRNEISVTTTPLFNPAQNQPQNSSFWPRLLIVSLFTTMILLILLPLSNKRNRRWVVYKTKSVRNSFRFKKTPTTGPCTVVQNGTTSQA